MGTRTTAQAPSQAPPPATVSSRAGLGRWGAFTSSRLLAWLLALATAVAALVGSSPAEAAERVHKIDTPLVEIIFLDIGQGDAALITTIDGKKALVDTGPSRARADLMGRLKELGIQSLDALVLTHAHADHLGNARAIIEQIEVKAVLDAGVDHPSTVYAETLAAIEAHGIKYVQPRRGLAVKLGQHVILEMIAPEDPLLHGTRSDPNANSIVFRAVIGDTRVMFTGDAEAETEERLVALGPNALHSDVLKVAHHGSRYATHDAFLKAVHPAVAVISCSENNVYGHPAPETLARLERDDVDVFITADVGDILFASDGPRYSLAPRPIFELAALGLKSPVDINTADEKHLKKLPGIGKARAKSIIARRNELGGYTSVDQLAEIKGVSEQTLERIRPFVACSEPSAALLARAGTGAPLAGAAAGPHAAGAASGCIDVNHATVDELTALPGIGVSKAQAIVAHRSAIGAFRAVEQLTEVRGIGARTVAKFDGLACVGSSRGDAAVAAPPVIGGAPILGPGDAARAADVPIECTGLDVNTASADSLTALPGIGPAKAQAIVAHREAHGPFSAPEALVEVHGIGAKTVAKFRDRVCASASGHPSAYVAPHAALPLSAAVVPTRPIGGAMDPANCRGIDLNRASANELIALPGIGPAKADAIVAYRDSHGPFRTVDQLVEVRGIGARTLDKMRDQLCAGTEVAPPRVVRELPAEHREGETYNSPPGSVAGAPQEVTAPGTCEGIDLNTATAEDLTALPGIGPSKAEAIIAHRAENGPFTSADDLLRVRGIGPRTLHNMRALLCVSHPMEPEPDSE